MAPDFFNLRNEMEMSGQLHNPATSTSGKAYTVVNTLTQLTQLHDLKILLRKYVNKDF
jgi:hypothetical protein